MKKSLRFLISIFSYILILFPRTWVRKSGSWLGFLWFDVFGFRKEIVLSNINIAFPEWSDDKKLAVGRESVYQLGYNFAEFLTIPALSPKWIAKNAVIEGIENLRAAQAHGKGVLMLSLHIGNGDVGANVLVQQGIGVYIISKRFKTKWFDDIWFSIRGARGVQYIDAHGPNNAFDILKALKKKSGVVFVLDQFMGKPYGIETEFFGKKTGTAYGLALFAQKTKAPVLPLYTYEGTDGKIHVVIEPALDTESCLVDDNKDQSILNLTQSFNDRIEKIVRQHPEQWMWVHRRWKDFE